MMVTYLIIRLSFVVWLVACSIWPLTRPDLPYVDADWAGCPDSRRSTTGYVIYLGINALSDDPIVVQ